MTVFTIHTSIQHGNPAYNRSYAPAFIPIGHANWVDGKHWDFAKLLSYIGPGHGTEVDLIERDLYLGGIGRIAMAVDGQETVVYRVTGDRLFRTIRFEVDEGAELRFHEGVQPPMVIQASVA
jgi:hypothetical protein